MAYLPDIEAKDRQKRDGVRMASHGKVAPVNGPEIQKVEETIKTLKIVRPCCFYGNRHIIFVSCSENRVDAYIDFHKERFLINFCPWCGGDMRNLKSEVGDE